MVKRSTRSAAWRMSSSSLRGSCGIDYLAALVDRLQQIGVPDCPRHDQVNLAMEEVFQPMKQSEISVGMLPRLQRVKLDQEIKVAALGVESAVGGGAEQLQGGHAKATAKRVQIGAVFFDQLDHVCL